MDTPQRRRQPRPIDFALLRLVVEGVADPRDVGVPQRLVVLRARYGSSPTVGPLVREAWDVLLRAQERADEEADRAFLNGLVDGSGRLLSEDTFPRMEPLFAKYAEGSEMFALLEKAAIVFGDAAQEATYWAIAGEVINEVKKRLLE